jgi:ABC-type dipeptide/oligopeptide/nickel transport system permease component
MSTASSIARLLSLAVRYGAVVVATAVLLHALPGSPWSDLETLPEALRVNLERTLGCQDLLWIKVLKALRAAFLWDFGPSISFPQAPCASILARAWPFSLTIGFWTLTVAWPLSWLVACWLASRPRMRRLLHPCFALFLSAPAFLVVGVAIWKGWATPLAPLPHQMAAAVLCLISVPFAQSTLYLTRQLEHELDQPYLQFALMQGQSLFQTLLRHSLIPCLARLTGLFAPQAAALLTGSAAVEKALMIPGLGCWFVDSVLQRDASMILALTACFTATLLLCSSLAEWLRHRLDPRLRMVAIDTGESP